MAGGLLKLSKSKFFDDHIILTLKWRTIRKVMGGGERRRSTKKFMKGKTE